ncbi:Npun_R1517 family heterocyst differentiation transcriptional regulator [Desertifilum sp. FACHB-1129]|uniref:Npun R1517 domain-containing protein n=3 Tax=Cyanophyceae TaxID=3028117 RepID=A0A1E5QGR0_9CYAN|nr:MULTISPECIES: Npun_R1517 family heterocyst differentiation transcriptional regulator [Cyanophyceae]MCD8488258.1 Npun_R1517 family heterocyst differentiation transcriptional regulator [Desertifilum sp.]MDA0209616.1 Npun_R1517 family heterocyst differentiation transcriptional regulator [Cyanobacteria bacterium FC1]MDI9640709.1 Npun_R1517 family heterocyst differentiation transcriptional regulator [Geitlerinema splendidum]MDK3159146.1 Npun_R1517 family heterocyst differentiation transcriptional
MQSEPLEYQSSSSEIGIYECEVYLKFRLIEEKGALSDRDQLLDTLLDAFAEGEDGYLESLQVHVEAQRISEKKASARMRRKLIRLRNSDKLK